MEKAAARPLLRVETPGPRRLSIGKAAAPPQVHPHETNPCGVRRGVGRDALMGRRQRASDHLMDAAVAVGSAKRILDAAPATSGPNGERVS